MTRPSGLSPLGNRAARAPRALVAHITDRWEVRAVGRRQDSTRAAVRCVFRATRARIGCAESPVSARRQRRESVVPPLWQRAYNVGSTGVIGQTRQTS